LAPKVKHISKEESQLNAQINALENKLKRLNDKLTFIRGRRYYQDRIRITEMMLKRNEEKLELLKKRSEKVRSKNESNLPTRGLQIVKKRCESKHGQGNKGQRRTVERVSQDEEAKATAKVAPSEKGKNTI
jgi:hypothetical protein